MGFKGVLLLLLFLLSGVACKVVRKVEQSQTSTANLHVDARENNTSVVQTQSTEQVLSNTEKITETYRREYYPDTTHPLRAEIWSTTRRVMQNAVQRMQTDSTHRVELKREEQNTTTTNHARAQIQETIDGRVIQNSEWFWVILSIVVGGALLFASIKRYT